MDNFLQLLLNAAILGVFVYIFFKTIKHGEQNDYKRNGKKG